MKKNIVFQYFIHLFVQLVLLFIYTFTPQDLGVWVFGSLLYCPYVIMFSLINYVIFIIAKRITQNNLTGIIVFPLILIVWFLIHPIKLRFWELSLREVLIYSFVLVALNFVTYLKLRSTNKSVTT
jgi:hypothetical protein